MREYARRLLRQRYEVTAVSNGAEALRSALAHPPDLILSEARTSDSASEPVDLNDVVESATKNLDAIIRETGAVVTSTALPTVRADRVPLSQVMQNLLSNALKYRSALPPRADLWAERDHGCWRLAIRDNGIGIPQRFQNQIFGLFKRLHDRTEYPGSGMGLAICQKIIEPYGGRIWVESEEGQGSTFFFTLPDPKKE